MTPKQALKAARHEQYLLLEGSIATGGRGEEAFIAAAILSKMCDAELASNTRKGGALCVGAKDPNQKKTIA